MIPLRDRLYLQRRRAGSTRLLTGWLLAGLVLAGLALATPLPAQEPRRVTLEEALAIALERSPRLEVARADRDAVAADRLGVWGSFLPSLRLNYGYQRSSQGRLDAIGQSISQTSHTLQLSSSYDLFTGFRRTADLRGSALRIDAQDATVREEEFDTRLQVKAAYYVAIAARDLARVEADRLQRQTDQLAFVREMVARGSATRSDELRSSVDLNNARLAVLTTENAVRQTSFQLAAAIGLDEPVAPGPEAELDLEPVARGVRGSGGRHEPRRDRRPAVRGRGARGGDERPIGLPPDAVHGSGPGLAERRVPTRGQQLERVAPDELPALRRLRPGELGEPGQRPGAGGRCCGPQRGARAARPGRRGLWPDRPGFGGP